MHRENKTISTGSIAPTIAKVLAAVCFPFSCFSSCVSIDPNDEVLVSYYGVPDEILAETGVYCRPSCCGSRTLDKISIAAQTFRINNIEARDSNSSTILVDVSVTYRIKDIYKYVFNTDKQALSFIKTKITEAVCALTTQYPFDATGKVDSLKRITPEMKEELLDSLKRKVEGAGLEVISFMINNINYTSDLNQRLLARQEAQAQVVAQDATANAVAGTVLKTIGALEKGGVKFEESAKAELAGNLLLSLTNHSGAHLSLIVNGSANPVVASSST